LKKLKNLITQFSKYFTLYVQIGILESNFSGGSYLRQILRTRFLICK